MSPFIETPARREGRQAQAHQGKGSSKALSSDGQDNGAERNDSDPAPGTGR